MSHSHLCSIKISITRNGERRSAPKTEYGGQNIKEAVEDYSVLLLYDSAVYTVHIYQPKYQSIPTVQ